MVSSLIVWHNLCPRVLCRMQCAKCFILSEIHLYTYK